MDNPKLDAAYLERTHAETLVDYAKAFMFLCLGTAAVTFGFVLVSVL